MNLSANPPVGFILPPSPNERPAERAARLIKNRRSAASASLPPYSPGTTWANPLDAGDGMALADPYGGAPSYMGEVEGAAVPPPLGTARPAMPQFAPRDYRFPDPVALPQLASAPVRDVAREGKFTRKAGMQAGLVGLLLGGAPGALAAAQGALGGAQQESDRLAAGERQLWQDTTQGALQDYGLRRQAYGDAMEQVGQQMRSDLAGDRLANQQYATNLSDWAKEQERDYKTERDANTNALKQAGLDVTALRNQNQALIGLLNAGTRGKMADIAENSLGLRILDTFADNDRADSGLGLRKEALKLRREHDAWMKASADRRMQIQNQMLQIRQDAARNKALGGATPAQKASVLKQLTLSPLVIKAMREEVGNPPDPSQKEAYALWLERKKDAEESAQAMRRGFNELASTIGYQWDGRGYTPVMQTAPPPPPARGMTPQEGVDMLSGTNRVEPLLLPSRRMPVATPTPAATATPPAKATPAPRVQGGNSKYAGMTDEQIKKAIAQRFLGGK